MHIVKKKNNVSFGIRKKSTKNVDNEKKFLIRKVQHLEAELETCEDKLLVAAQKLDVVRCVLEKWVRFRVPLKKNNTNFMTKGGNCG